MNERLPTDGPPSFPGAPAMRPRFTIGLLLHDFFRNFPCIEDDATSKAFEQVVPEILDKLDTIKRLLPPI